MNLFRRRAAPVHIDPAVCQLWIEAGGPYPFDWFMRQARDVQETLAEIGIEDKRAFAMAISKAIHDPAMYEAEHFKGEEAVEEELSKRLSLEALQRFLGNAPTQEVHTPAPRPPRLDQEDMLRDPPVTMAGQLKRGEELVAAREAIRQNGLKSALQPRSHKIPRETT